MPQIFVIGNTPREEKILEVQTENVFEECFGRGIWDASNGKKANLWMVRDATLDYLQRRGGHLGEVEDEIKSNQRAYIAGYYLAVERPLLRRDFVRPIRR